MITATIIVITVLVSIRAFKDHALTEKLIFHPPSVKQGEWHRLFSYGVLHADYAHLIFNMFTLYFFGMDIERACKLTLGETPGSLCYILLYLSSLLVSDPPHLLQAQGEHLIFRTGRLWSGLGDHLRVHANQPDELHGHPLIPIYLPAFLFGIIFLLISLALDRKQTGGINHSAHITGGIYGVVYMAVVFSWLADVNLVRSFIGKIRIDSLSNLFHFGF